MCLLSWEIPCPVELAATSEDKSNFFCLGTFNYNHHSLLSCVNKITNNCITYAGCDMFENVPDNFLNVQSSQVLVFDFSSLPSK